MKVLYMFLNERLTQGEQEDSFVGGKPRLPIGVRVPSCALCRSRLTFFFQIAFPANHVWGGRSLAVFACTSCADESHLIPEMLSGPLQGADIPQGFLESYQRNFRFLTFPTNEGKAIEEYPERVQFRAIRLSEDGTGPAIGKIGGKPTWILSDESPKTYATRVPMRFLFEINEGVEFDIVPGAPPQIELGLTGDPEPSPEKCYRLFIGNKTYFFGTEGASLFLIYAITQVP